MKTAPLRRFGATIAATVVVVVAATASCAGSDPGEAASPPADPSRSGTASASSGSATSQSDPQSESQLDPEPVTLADDKPFGPGCDRYASGVGRPLREVEAMPTWLFVLSSASLRDSFGKMEQVGLGRRKDVTFFIPTNQAINSLALDTRGDLVLDDAVARRFFGHHVVRGRLLPSDLDGEHRTLSDDILPIGATGKQVSVGAQGAAVLCGNIHTEGAVIYVVDQALIS